MPHRAFGYTDTMAQANRKSRITDLTLSATLLKKTLEGATSQGAETELIHLYELDYKGCRSCFAC